MIQKIFFMVGVVLACFSGAHAAPQQSIRASSDVANVMLVPQTVLPDAPAVTKEQRDCTWYLTEPKTDVGRLVVQHGWAVTGEQPLGPYRLVSFAGELISGTSGGCDLLDGHVGVFSAGKLVALASSRTGQQSVGQIRAIEGDAVRLWSVHMDQVPEGDLHAMPDGSVRLTHLAKSETLCGGKASIPNVYGMPINKARLVLKSNGWSPVPQKTSSGEYLDSRVDEFRKSGIVEAEDCSGTGFAFCQFIYRGVAGKLSIVTWNEQARPPVYNYDVDCAK